MGLFDDHTSPLKKRNAVTDDNVTKLIQPGAFDNPLALLRRDMVVIEGARATDPGQGVGAVHPVDSLVSFSRPDSCCPWLPETIQLAPLPKEIMFYRFRTFIGALAGVAAAIMGASSAGADPTEHRVALIIGNAAYKTGPLALPANDAGLIAQTLQAAGFDVVGARDLDGDALRHTFRDFLDKVSNSGPDTVAFVYVSGYGVQYEGENYIVPVDATLEHDVDVPIQAVRLSDYTRPLSTMPLKARFIVVDGARDNPFVKTGHPLASGLALVNAEPGVVYAFNAAPGTVAPEGPGPYGPYAQALAEMIREGGLGPAEVFDRVRQRVNSATSGAFVPWSAARIDTPFVFFERAADAPPPAVSRADRERRRARALRELEVEDAYHEALDRDTLEAYLDFLDAYPNHLLAKRVRVIVAARREAIIWRRTYERDTPEAYWTYLDRYPDGPHAWDARRRLRHLAAELDAPPTFVHFEYDVPPPPPDEFVFIHRRVVFFSDPYYDFAPPPPPPIYYIPPPPPDFAILVAPDVVVEAYVLPVPVFVPVPRWCDPPHYVAPPPNNVVFANIHNTVVVNNVTNITNVTSVNNAPGTPATPPTVVGAPIGAPPAPGAPPHAGTATGLTAGQIGAGAVAAGVTAAAFKVALPPSVVQKAAAPLQGAPNAPKPVTATAPLLTPDGKAIPPLVPRSPPSPPAAGPLQTPAAVAPTVPPSGPVPSAAKSVGLPPPPTGPGGPSFPASSPPNVKTPDIQRKASVPPTPPPPAATGPGSAAKTNAPPAGAAPPRVVPESLHRQAVPNTPHPPEHAPALKNSSQIDQQGLQAQRDARRQAEQQRARELQQRQAAVEAQRRAEQQRAADIQRQNAVRADQAEAHRRAEQQRSAEVQRQNAVRAQQNAARAQQEARRRQAQQAPPPKDQKTCGIPGTPPCPH